MKKVKCELTIKQLFVINESIQKFKKSVRKKFLGEIGIGKYINETLFHNSTKEERKKMTEEWRELKNDWNKANKKEEIEPAPSTVKTDGWRAW